MAMEEWVNNPHAETALSNILPCVDLRTTNRTLIKSKQVVVDIANVVNGFIDTYANSNPTNHVNSNYYNQSGPLMPHLCYPYDSQLQDLPCPSEQVSVANASLVSGHLAGKKWLQTSIYLLCKLWHTINPKKAANQNVNNYYLFRLLERTLFNPLIFFSWNFHSWNLSVFTGQTTFSMYNIAMFSPIYFSGLAAIYLQCVCIWFLQQCWEGDTWYVWTFSGSIKH